MGNPELALVTALSSECWSVCGLRLFPSVYPSWMPSAVAPWAAAREEPLQQPVHVFEVAQCDLLGVDRVDSVTHTFQAQLFFSLVLRGGGLDPHLSQEGSVFPLDSEGRPTFKPSARWFWDKVEISNAQGDLTFKDVMPVRREGDDLVLRFRVQYCCSRDSHPFFSLSPSSRLKVDRRSRRVLACRVACAAAARLWR